MNNPPYKQEGNYREFYESVGKLYPEEDVVYCTLRGLLRRKFVNAFLEKSNGLFLDLGCNRGYYIANYKNGKAVGIDIAFSVLKIAKSRNLEACFVQGDAQNLSFFRSNSINSILCSEIIEHVSNSQRV
ncbi:MAG: class I SAM-dependent methyltransferase, partial [bacterium]